MGLTMSGQPLVTPIQVDLQLRGSWHSASGCFLPCALLACAWWVGGSDAMAASNLSTRPPPTRRTARLWSCLALLPPPRPRSRSRHSRLSSLRWHCPPPPHLLLARLRLLPLTRLRLPQALQAMLAPAAVMTALR